MAIAFYSTGITEDQSQSNRDLSRVEIAYSLTGSYDELITSEVESKTTNRTSSRITIALLRGVVLRLDVLRMLLPGERSRAETEPVPTITSTRIRSDAEFNQVLKRLVDLLRDADEEGAIPELYAFETTYNLLGSTREHLTAMVFPRATVSSDESGTIFIFWRNSHRKVHLVVPSDPDASMYIYHEEGNIYAVEYDVTGRTLANWLEWYAQA